MGYTVLERLLEVERLRKRAAPGGGFSVPVMHERAVDAGVVPMLVTSTRGKLVATRPFAPGFARCGIFPCPRENEPEVFTALRKSLQETSAANGWGNRCTSIQAARARLEQSGRRVRSIVLAKADLPGIGVALEDAEKLMAIQGYVTLHGSTQTLVADLPAGHGLVVSDAAGLYMRVDDFLGLMLLNVDTRWVVVAP